MSEAVPPDTRPMATRLGRWHRFLAVVVLGFASGLPLALVGGALQTWLTVEGLDLTTLGFLTLIGIPYTCKFLWAPLLDRFELPWLGRRRGWIVVTQLAICGALLLMAEVPPISQLPLFALVAVAAAFLSASHDVVVDAYRTDVLLPAERGLGASLSVLGYRSAMVISGGIALVWAQQWGSWPQVYRVMAMVMGACAVFSLVALPSVRSDIKPLATSATRELFGFAAMLAGVVAGYFIGGWLLQLAGFDLDGTNPWLRLVFLVVRTGLAIALGLYLARRVGFDTLLKALTSYFASPGAWAFLGLIVLYKVGDAFAMSLGTAFLIRGVGFEQLEVGLANKSVGLLMTIAGALIGGAVMMRVRLRTALMAFGVLQLVSNLGFYALSVLGKGAWGVLTVPAFNLGIVALADPTPMDGLLLAAISIDNLSGGMGTAALVALLMGLCNLRFSATHFALLSAFASLGRVFIGPVAGVVADQFGWPQFFLVSLVVGAPSLFMVWWLRREIDAVDSRPGPVTA